MPNPYEHLFGEEDHQQPPPQDQTPEPDFSMPPEPQTDPLDVVLEKIAVFQKQAEAFSVLLSQTKAVDYETHSAWWSLFVNTGTRHDQGSLAGEKASHRIMTSKFVDIIVPMKALAMLHLETLKAFVADIDEGYFSIQKEEIEVKNDKTRAINGLNLQRKILAEAARDLDILDQALKACESRMRKYVNAGGVNNLSASELALLTQNRSQLTSGREHQFDYTFFNINLLDKTAMAFGYFMKETSSQYLQKLLFVFENR